MKLTNLYESSVPNWWDAERHWYHPKTGTHYALELGYGGTNHTTDVQQNPEKYGLTQDDLPELKKPDYDDATLFRTMQNGWVRVMFDRRDPDSNSNIEGLWFPGLRETAEAMRNALRHIRRFAVIKRFGPGEKEGDVYIFNNVDQLDEFIETGKPPEETKRTPPRQVAAEALNLTEMAGGSRIYKHLRDGTPFITMSAQKGNLSRKENQERMNRLQGDLQRLGFGVIETEGYWEGEKEDSFFAPIDYDRRSARGIKNTAARLGRKYDQDAVIASDGETVWLIDQEGNVLIHFDAAVLTPEDLKLLPGKTAKGGMQFGLVSKHDSRFKKKRGKMILDKPREES